MRNEQIDETIMTWDEVEAEMERDLEREGRCCCEAGSGSTRSALVEDGTR